MMHLEDIVKVLSKKELKNFIYADFAHLSSKTKDTFYQVLNKAIKAALSNLKLNDIMKNKQKHY